MAFISLHVFGCSCNEDRVAKSVTPPTLHLLMLKNSFSRWQCLMPLTALAWRPQIGISGICVLQKYVKEAFKNKLIKCYKT